MTDSQSSPISVHSFSGDSTAPPRRKSSGSHAVVRGRSVLMRSRANLKPTGEKHYLHDTFTVDVEMDDGVKLKTSVMKSRHPEPRPVVIMRSAYFRKNVDSVAFAVAFVDRNIHVVLQDIRGRFSSEGNFSMLEQREKADSAALLKWIAQQPWCNKKVAFLGISMSGFTTWASYGSSVDTYKDTGLEVCAVCPLLTSSDIFKQGMMVNPQPDVHDPILKLDLTTRYIDFMWTLQKKKNRKFLGSRTLGTFKSMSGTPLRQIQKSWKESQKHLPLSTIDVAVTKQGKASKKPTLDVQLRADPTDPFWEPLDHSRYARIIGEGGVASLATSSTENMPSAPVLFSMTGWYDIFCRETINDFLAAVKGSEETEERLSNKALYLTVGPWAHIDVYFDLAIGSTVRMTEAAFGIGKNVNEEFSRPRVSLYCLGVLRWKFVPRAMIGNFIRPQSKTSSQNFKNRAWRFYGQWPPKQAWNAEFEFTANHLLRSATAGNRLTEQPEPGYDSFVYDPENPTPTVGGRMFHPVNVGPMRNNKLEKRSDVIVYTTVPLEEDVEVTGNVTLKVKVSSSARSMDVHARLCDVTRYRSRSFNVTDGITRVTLKEGESWPKEVTIDVGPCCVLFRKGHCIRLQIAGGSFPLYSRNLGYGEPNDTATRLTKAEHKIYWQDSTLTLPVITVS